MTLAWADWGIATGIVLVLMVVVWLASLVRRDASIIDWFWGPAFALFAWTLVRLADGPSSRIIVLSVAISVWALRLGLHIALRSRGKGEDPRYTAMRERSGPAFWWISLFKVNLFQGLLVGLVAAPVFQIARTPQAAAPWSLFDLAGGLLFAVGHFIESVGDYQLTRFRADPANAGRVLDHGLWRYTRHPNYFGDALVWWGIALPALATPSGFWVLVSPLVMTLLLVKVSGAALLESGLKETRPGYRDYIRNTPAFVPWFPKKGDS